MPDAAPAIGLISLGCPKAGSDAEALLTALAHAGYATTSDCRAAALVIVNTCGFITAAVEESLQAIHEALSENSRVIVTGCLGKRADFVRAAHPKVLAITGPGATDAVLSLVQQHCPHDVASQHPFPAIKSRRQAAPQTTDAVPQEGIRLTPRHYSWLKISEGCNHPCSFCIIPTLRGPLHSRSLPSILQEAEALAAAGTRELLVIAQDSSAYGLDVRYRTAFWQGRPMRTRFFELCSALGELGLWVRLHYVYPYPHVDALLPLMAQGKILPYLDVPLQHASPRILALMKRPAAAEKMLVRFASWRNTVPDLAIRSTFITGFPGETEREFNALLDFLDEAQLDRVGAFAYSPVEGASANDLPGALPEAERLARRDILLEHQAQISRRKLEAKIGQTLTVLIDHIEEDGSALARSAYDAPDVDGLVIIPDGAHLTVGEFAEAQIVDSDTHDLYAVNPGADTAHRNA